MIIEKKLQYIKKLQKILLYIASDKIEKDKILILEIFKWQNR